MDIFSHSRLSKYEDCPASFYRHYVLKALEVFTEPLVLGKACHSVIESAMRLNTMDENFFKVLSLMAAENAPLPIDPEEAFSLTYRKIVLDEFDLDNNIEGHFQVPLSDDPFAPEIQGYIDLWRSEDVIRLIDWKSNRKAYNPTDTKQLSLYAWQLSKLTGQAVIGKLVFLRLNESREHHFTYRDMEDAREWALTLALEIQEKLYRVSTGEDYKSLFQSTPGDACRYCGFAFECIDGELPIPGELKTYDEAVELGAEMLRMESALEQSKSMLKTYVEACGPITVGGRKFQMNPTTYWNWGSTASKAAFDRLKKLGKDPYDFLKPDSYHTKKLKWGEKDFESLGAVKKTKYVFKHVSAN